MTNKVEQFKVLRNRERDLSFQGERLADVSSWHHSGPNSNRWTELCLYRTEGGRFVLSRIRRTLWQGESNSFEGHVFEDPDELAGILEGEDGTISDLAKELVEEASEVEPAFKDQLVEEV